MTTSMQFSFRNFFFFMASAGLFFVFLYVSRELMIPVAFSLLFAFILHPVCGFFEKYGIGRIMAIILALLMVFIILAGSIILFSTQLANLANDLNDFGSKLTDVFSKLIVFVNENNPIYNELSKESLIEEGTEWLEKSWQGLITKTFSGTFAFVSGFFLVLVYTFLILLYRGGIVKALQSAVSPEKRDKIGQMVKDIQKVGQSYLTGMVLLILILGTVNSVGLWIIGIDYPFLFGFLAGLLVILPYIGTIVGGLLPTLYAFMTHDSLWMPVAVIILFWVVQMLEGNFLSPKIIGGKLSVNALTAIFSLILGGYIWGLAGMILFLPFTAILKVTFDHLHPLQPIADLMGDHLYTSNKSKPGFFTRIIEKLKSKD